MEYREHLKTKDKISVIGLGTGPLGELNEKEASKILEFVFERGVNYFDFATADAKTFSYVGNTLSSVRDQLHYQVHFGANYETGEYGWTLDLDTVKEQIDWQLKMLKTDHIDYGFIHCLDEISDWETYQENGVLNYLLKMKEEGVVDHIGLSSHTPELAQKVLDTGLIDQLMFSINPAYDCEFGEYANGSLDSRNALYERCASLGVGISVMKPFAGGQLLNQDTSPFKVALTPYQCIQYALDKPGVITVLPGMGNFEQAQEILGFFDTPAQERDYSILGNLAPEKISGRCVYCSHCHPCPAGLNIALINKYYDLSKAGDSLAKEHYEKLDKKASDCISCGHCDKRCPFHVEQSKRMKEIEQYFGH